MNSEPYRVILVGCGSIGALKFDDVDGPGTDHALTHAHAWSAFQKTELSALVDTDMEKRKRASDKWKVPSFSSISLAVSEAGPAEIIVIATPDATHLRVFNEALQVKPKLIVIEKPCASSLDDSRAILVNSTVWRVPVVVNYTRRFCPAFQVLAQQIEDGKIQIQHARLVYGRGLLRDGCHALDLFRMLFGAVLEAKTLGEILDPRLPDDPSVTAWMRFEQCDQVLLCATDSLLYSVFELDLWMKDAVLRFGDHGNTLSIYPAIPEATYGRGYKSMPGNPSRTEETRLTMGLTRMVEECVAYLDHPSCGLSSTVEDAVKVHEMIERLRGGELR